MQQGSDVDFFNIRGNVPNNYPFLHSQIMGYSFFDENKNLCILAINGIKYVLDKIVKTEARNRVLKDWKLIPEIHS